MQDQKSKLLAVSPADQFAASFLGVLKPFFEIQLASSVDMALFLVKEWEPDLVVANMAESLQDFPPQCSEYFDNPEKSLILMVNSLPSSLEKYHRWNVSSLLDTTDSPEKALFQIRSLHKKVSRLSVNKASGSAEESDNLAYKEVLGLKIYENDYMVKRGDDVVTTTPTQFKLLIAFANHPDQLLSRSWIKQEVWQNSDISPRSIDAQISKLKKLIPEFEGSLMNIYGKGYILAESHKKVA
jgi:DNA-binding response OmpR family regulator